MSIDMENIFKARAKSTWSFLVENGQGCYIPAYQRQYSWNKENVVRLFEDAVHGMNMLLTREETVTFLGTIITIHDTKHKTIQPIYKGEVAQRVMTIIDGQQRICTFLMANIALHDQIKRSSLRFQKKKEPQFSWISDQAQRLLPELEETFMLDMRTGDDNYQFYPRIIRAYDDAWSRKKGQAMYTSPIALLIWSYFEHHKNGEKSPFRHKPQDDSGEILAQHKTIVDVFSLLQRYVSNYTGKNFNNFDFPDLLNIFPNKKFIDAVLNLDLPDEVSEYLKDKQDDPLYNMFSQLLRLIILAKYMNNRMAFTVVTTESEDDAFDMFEALNTTGEPLTAYETFKPKVIEVETLENFETSDSKKHLDRIEIYLDRFPKAEQKQKATSEMLVPFALSETGFKLPKRLSDQRRYLRDQYVELLKPNQILFVERLSHVANFMHEAWEIESDKKITFNPLQVTNDESVFSLLALKSLKHLITIAPLSRFYSEAFKAAKTDNKDKRREEFEDAVKATAAFSMLWRGAFGGTENIDSHYRDIMRLGFSSLKINPLAANPENAPGIVSLVNYKKALRYILESKGNIKDRVDWVRKASQIPIYRANKDVARFLLICASNNSIVDDSAPGLIKKGQDGVLNMMTSEIWENEDYFTVEHIAPQSKSTEWDLNLYEPDEQIHRLGNLILVPQEVNSILGNRNWGHKLNMYKLLSAKDPQKFNEYKKACAKDGLVLSKKAEEVIDKTKFLSMCESVSRFPNSWDKDIIDKRSERIAELAYDNLWAWLKPA